MKRLFHCWLFLLPLFSVAQSPDAFMRRNLFLLPGEDAGAKLKRNIVCRAIVNRNTVYTGEPFTVAYELCSALQSFTQVEKMPSFNGFSVYEIKGEKKDTLLKLAAQYYNCYTLRKLQLYPNEAGRFTLEPAVLKNTVTFQLPDIQNIANPQLPAGYLPTDDIPGYTKELHEYTVQSEQPAIQVLPLPEAGRPDFFTGAVGRFSISAACEKAEVEKGGSVSVVFTISGTGNFKMINQLAVTTPADCEVFEPRVKEGIDETSIPFTGKKEFLYTFSPLKEGSLVIPATRFAWFNPETRSYQTAESRPITLKVVPATGIPVQTSKNEQANADDDPFSPVYLVGGGMAMLAALAIFLFRRKKGSPKPVPVPAKQKQAEPVNRSLLLQRAAHMQHHSDARYYFTVLLSELQSGAALLLQLPEAGGANVYETLLLKDGATAIAYKNLTDELHRFIYAYETPAEDKAYYYQRAAALLERIKA